MSSNKSKKISTKLILALLLCWAFLSPSLFAQDTNDGGTIAFVSSSNAGFKKDVYKSLRKDSRRTKTELSIEELSTFLESDFAAYKKVAVIAYVGDIKGALLSKLQELQTAEPGKYVVWLTYKGRKAPKLPEGIDAVSSASKQSYSEKGYGKKIVPHLFG